MNAQHDSWHFSRPALADAYLQGFQLGQVSARGLFTRRRMGKDRVLEARWESLNTPIKKMKAGGKLPMGAEASLELDLAEKEKLSIPAIQTALQAADKSKKKLLLVIDEAQVLAAPAHKNLAHSFESLLHKSMTDRHL